MKFGLIFLGLACLSCTWGKQSEPPPTLSSPLPARSAGEVCAKPTDCTLGLTCVDLRWVDPTVHEQRKCEQSEGCARSGLCGYNAGRFVARHNTHCVRSRECSEKGTCALSDNRCIPKHPTHCTQARICREGKQCHLRSAVCVWRPEQGGFVPILDRDGQSILHVLKTEVTQGQFTELLGHNPSYHKACGSMCPVERVSMESTFRYADILSRRAGLDACYGQTGIQLGMCTGFRRPTDREWQWLAFEAPHTAVSTVPWSKENSGFESKAVCSSGVQRFGLCDVLGNVWEWVHTDVSLGQKQHEPRGKAPVRGGSFAFRKASLSAPSRWVEDTGEGGMTVGFRVLTRTRLE